MSDLESLFALLAVIYLADCLLFLRTGSVLFRRWGRRWHLASPHSVLANARGFVGWSNPLPIFPSSFIGCIPPCVLAPNGILNWTPFCLQPTGRPLPVLIWLNWEEVRQVHVDRRSILINGKSFVTARSSEEALQIADRIRAVQSLPSSARSSHTEQFIRFAFDAAALQRRIDTLQLEVGRLAVFSKVLAVFLFVVSPVLIHRWGLEEVGWWLLGAIYLQSGWLALLFYRAHRRLSPKDVDERFVRVATALLAPLSAIRCPEVLGRNTLVDFHPLAMARALCSKEEFVQFSGQIYRDLHTPIMPDRPSREESVIAALDWSAGRWRHWALVALREAGLDPESLLAPPVRAEVVNVSYCPRCQEQFTSLEAVCAECGQRKTVAWSVLDTHPRDP